MMARRGLHLTLLCLGLAACTSDAPPKDPNERSATELYVLKGVQYMEASKLDIAQRDLQHALELDAKNVDAHTAMGVLQERLGQPALAEEQFKQALALDPNNIDASVNYGRMLCAQGQYETAMKYYHTAIDSKLYNTPWVALTNAGICAANQGQTEEAEGYLRKALDSSPNFPPALLEMAKITQVNGNSLSARAFLQRFEATGAPSTAESLALGIQVEQAMGNSKDASAYLKKLLRLFPESRQAVAYRKLRSAP